MMPMMMSVLAEQCAVVYDVELLYCAKCCYMLFAYRWIMEK
jgi:hypothetical protein